MVVVLVEIARRATPAMTAGAVFRGNGRAANMVADYRGMQLAAGVAFPRHKSGFVR